MKEWNDVDVSVASATVLLGDTAKRVDLFGFIVRHPNTPSFVAYCWLCGGAPIALGNNHLPGVNKAELIAYARKDDRFRNLTETVNW